MYDHGSQWHQHICQDIGYHDIIALIPHFVLYFFIGNDVADHHVELCRINAIHFTVLCHSFHCTDIQVGSHSMFCAEHQR